MGTRKTVSHSHNTRTECYYCRSKLKRKKTKQRNKPTNKPTNQQQKEKKKKKNGRRNSTKQKTSERLCVHKVTKTKTCSAIRISRWIYSPRPPPPLLPVHNYYGTRYHPYPRLRPSPPPQGRQHRHIQRAVTEHRTTAVTAAGTTVLYIVPAGTNVGLLGRRGGPVMLHALILLQREARAASPFPETASVVTLKHKPSRLA